MRTSCPICGNMLIEPVGKKGILLVGDAPGKDDIIRGVPFLGKTGELLKSELAVAGMSIQECRLTNLWTHAKNDDSCNIEWHLTKLAEEIQLARYVLLMGSDLTKAIFNAGVMELSGLEVHSDLFPKKRIFVAPSPNQVLFSPVGEFKLALHNFVAAIRKDEK